MGITIWENENKSFDKICDEIRKNGGVINNSKAYMAKTGNLGVRNDRTQQNGRTYGFISQNGKEILLGENDYMIECTFIYDKKHNQVSISYDKRTGEYAYFLHSNNNGHNLLALVSSEKADFPIYSTDNSERPLLQFAPKGKLPDLDKKSTIRETIEKTLLEHPILKNEAYDILTAFDEILSLDNDRQIRPLTPLEIENAKLRFKIQEMERSIKNQAKSHEETTLKLGEEIDNLKKENEGLKSENGDQKNQITKLQTMLGKTLEFASRVRDSIAGKIFFKKPLKDLNLDGNALPEVEER